MSSWRRRTAARRQEQLLLLLAALLLMGCVRRERVVEQVVVVVTVTPGGSEETSPTGPAATETHDETQATQATQTPVDVMGATTDLALEEILPIISWGGFGSGGDSTAMCAAADDSRPWVFAYAYGGDDPLQLLRETLEITSGERFFVAGCNYPAGEPVLGRTALPDGSTEDWQAEADENGFWFVEWWSLPGEPLGRYTESIVSASGPVTFNFFVSPPTEPVMTINCYESEGQAQALLAGFQPGETVRLAIYGASGEESHQFAFEELVSTQIDVDGGALVQLPLRGHKLVVALGIERPAFVTDYLSDLVDPPEAPVSAYDFIRRTMGSELPVDCYP